MSRSMNANNDSKEPSEASIYQCDSSCYEIQQAGPYPHKCVYNDTLHQYKMRLKKAQMELTDKELIIALLKDEHVKMENYCRCSVEETQDIKARYYQLVQEMENIRKDNEEGKPTNENDESLASYLRSEVDQWKKENKEILDKIQLMDFDIQKLLQVVSEPGVTSEENVEVRLARLEEAIKNQPEVLASLHSKVTYHSVATTVSNQLEGSRVGEILRQAGDDLGGASEDPTVPKKELHDQTFNLPTIPSIGPEDDLRISIQIQRASKSKDLDRQSDARLGPLVPMRPHQVPTTDAATTTETLDDFLEIAAREKKFFDERVISDVSVIAPTSERLSELTSSEHEKIFQELPVDATRTPKKNWSDLELFEHFESTMFAGRENPRFRPILPFGAGVEEDKPTVRKIPSCCLNPNDRIGESDTFPPDQENNLQMVLFEGNLLVCCKSDDLPEKNSALDSRPKDNVPTALDQDEKSSLPESGRVTRSSTHEKNPLFDSAVHHEETLEEEPNDQEAKKKKIEDKISQIPAEAAINGEITSNKIPTSNSKPQDRRETEEIPIIYELEITPNPVSEEQIARKFVASYLEEQLPFEIEEDLKPSHEEKTVLQVKELEKVVHQLGDVIVAAKAETSTLHELKEDFKVVSEEWNQDFSKIKTNTDYTNKKLVEIEEHVKGLKTDMENLLNKQNQQRRDENMEEVKTDPNKVPERVKNLETRICKCGPRERKIKMCQPSASSRNKYKDCGKSNEENNTKMSFTIQSCVLTPISVIGTPYIVKFRNNVPALTYKINRKFREEAKRKECDSDN